jgi:N-acetylglucosamine kinase-like BadF-type ATPase
MMARYLGVDGGGSKTAFALIDDAGHVIARATAPTSYYFTEGFDGVERVLAQGVADICGQAGIDTSDIDAAFFGIPGYGEASGDIEQLDAVPVRVLGHDRYSCDNDMVCGWAGSLAGEDGINVISGTGSMTYGERQGTGCRVGGWGELFGDEGSAYWVATQGLNAFSRMSDGRLTRGPLYTLIKERLQLSGDLDVVSLVIDKWAGNRGSIASLATTVCEAARMDDEASARILSAAADELVALIETTRRIVGFTIMKRCRCPTRVECSPTNVFWRCSSLSCRSFLRSTTSGAPCSIRRWAPPSMPPSTAVIRCPPVPCTNSLIPEHDPKR